MKNALKIGFILMLIVGVQRALFSVMMVFGETGALDSDILYVVHVIAILFITLNSFKKGEAWAWWCLLLIGGIPPLYCTVVHGLNSWVIISWVLFLPAIVIPSGAFLRKK